MNIIKFGKGSSGAASIHYDSNAFDLNDLTEHGTYSWGQGADYPTNTPNTTLLKGFVCTVGGTSTTIIQEATRFAAGAIEAKYKRVYESSTWGPWNTY